MYLIALVLSITGIAIGWLPGIGWFGLVLAVAAGVIAASGLSNRKVVSVDIGYCMAAALISGLAVPWTLAYQSGYSGGILDGYFLQYPLADLLLFAGISLGAFVIFAVLGRLKPGSVLRPVMLVIAFAAFLSAAAFGASSWSSANGDPSVDLSRLNEAPFGP